MLITPRNRSSIICLPSIFENNKESYWFSSNLKSGESKWRLKLPSNLTCLNHFRLVCLEEALLLLRSKTLITSDRNLSVLTWMSTILSTHKAIRKRCKLRRAAPHKTVSMEGKRQWKRGCCYSILMSWIMTPTGIISPVLGFSIPMT